MRRKAFFLAIIIIFACPAITFSGESNHIDKRKCVYGAAIEKEIAACKSKLYLMDSENQVLSEVAEDAFCRMKYLRKKKAQMIEKMISENVPLKTKCINEYIGERLIENQEQVETFASAM